MNMRNVGIGSVAGATLLLLLIAVSSTQAQWIEAAPNLLPPPAQHMGALRARGAVAWAGTTALYYSNDTGATWQRSMTYPSHAGIMDIAIYDSLHVLVGTQGDGLYLTTDAGQTWINMTPGFSSTPPSYTQVAFDGSDSVLLALDYYSSTLYTSTDQGTTWNANQTTFANSTGSLCFAIAADKTIYVQSYLGGRGWLDKSTNLGQTWSTSSGPVDGDSNTLSADSCDASRLYLVNENVVAQSTNLEGDLNARIDLTTGGSWRTVSVKPLDYYSGAMASTWNVLFLGTVDNGGDGVDRSTDSGLTWQTIGGPTEMFDTRTIAAINNNTVLVLDASGSLWRTRNDGGHPLTLPEHGSRSALVLASQPVKLDRTACDDTARVAIPVDLVGCGIPSGMLDSLWLTGVGAGAGSAAFQIVGAGHAGGKTPRALAAIDSIVVEYTSANRKDSAELHLRYDLGLGSADTTIELIGSSSPLLGMPSKLHREAASAYAGAQASLPLAIDLNPAIHLDSLWPFITSIQGTYRWDSTVVSYVSYTPPAGWALQSLAGGGDTARFDIQKLTSAVAGSPLDLGTAIFQPANGQLATTWVTLPTLTISVGGQDIGLCVSENEDSHWAVKSLGAPSGVAPQRAPTTRDAPTLDEGFHVYPNPSDGNVWVTSSQELGEVTIAIYDMLGAERGRWEGKIEGNTPVLLRMPNADGIYTIVVHSAAGTYEMRAVRDR